MPSKKIRVQLLRETFEMRYNSRAFQQVTLLNMYSQVCGWYNDVKCTQDGLSIKRLVVSFNG